MASAAIGAALSLTMMFAQAQPTQSQLASQAKITEASARATALAKVPNGTVQSSELENENGSLIWSFDIAKPKSKDITEVQVDAISGKIASVKTETPAAQANEAKADRAGK
ncbi:MAG: PepSY domain-containing protein [Burkholderiaceae bacterium]